MFGVRPTLSKGRARPGWPEGRPGPTPYGPGSGHTPAGPGPPCMGHRPDTIVSGPKGQPGPTLFETAARTSLNVEILFCTIELQASTEVRVVAVKGNYQ